MHLTTVTCAGYSQSMITIKAPCKDPTIPLSPDANMQDYFLEVYFKEENHRIVSSKYKY